MEWQLILFLLLCLVGVLILLYLVRNKYNSPSSSEPNVQSFKEQVPTSPENPVQSISSKSFTPLKVKEAKTPDYEIPTFEPLQSDSESDIEKGPELSEDDLKTEELPFYKDPDYLNSRYSRIKEMMPSISEIRSQLDDFNRERREKAKRKGKKAREMKFGQFICQRTLEIIFGKPFPETKGVLVNPETGYPLEYDCWNEELQIALEYQGDQHRILDKNKNRYNMSKETFIKQYRRDEYKARQSQEDGVTFLVIWDDVKWEDIPSEIADLIPARYDGYRRDIVLVGGEDD